MARLVDDVLTEARMIEEIRNVYHNAHPETRIVYDRTTYRVNGDGDVDNWAIRWLIFNAATQS